MIKYYVVDGNKIVTMIDLDDEEIIDMIDSDYFPAIFVITSDGIRYANTSNDTVTWESVTD